MRLQDRIAEKMRGGMAAAQAAEEAEREVAEAAAAKDGPLVVTLNLKPLHREWLEAKCAAYGVSVDAFMRKAIAEMWQCDEWRRSRDALDKGDPAGTMLRSDFQGKMG